jgi:hypothetical protein
VSTRAMTGTPSRLGNDRGKATMRDMAPI